ncbi:MAG: Leucine--tRNA ligase [Candidatus Omnitrophica bacterium]|nr:Leucine--tRNA ligase [Candidatus Omnitrophota bacterium]
MTPLTPDQLYPYDKIEPKWQQYWLDRKTFAVADPAPGNNSRKLYVLDMFPYPSGAGLHVGHPEGYTATDIFCRYRRMRGDRVLHPMGWDAFGLPAEQYAIETGTHPAVTTQRNIANFRRQIQRLGMSYDWDREVDTTDPGYVRWTQWIFLQLYGCYYDRCLKKAMPVALLIDALSDTPKLKESWSGNAYLLHLREEYAVLPKDGRAPERFADAYRLAYVAEVPVWWCEALGCVLANEEVVDGKSERGGHPVVRRPMRQWMLRITAYADRLLQDLEKVNWSESIKEMQRNWIGRSEGATVRFQVEPAGGEGGSFEVYTTRPDTLFGATYVVLAPEHALVARITRPEQRAAVEAYVAACAGKSELERTELAKDKTGVFTGAYAINPADGRRIPVWIADYVLAGYGTGAIMAVPAHDERDYAFARKFGLEILEVVKGGDVSQSAYTAPGVAVNSGLLDGLKTQDAKWRMTTWLEEKGLGRGTVNYKLRDWLFSRQRYWGEPIPIVHCAKCGGVPVSESELPLRLPEMTDFKPSGNAEPPLSKAVEWVNTTCPACQGPAKRETNTMPQWAGSCWYYLRYIDPKNTERFCDPAKEQAWMPVDLYVGGAEHAVLHLLYSRFWHKFLYDRGLVSTPEPFTQLINQGMILGEDGQKMSKSRGNVINPDAIVDAYGADSLRLYEMFMGPLTQMKAWSMNGVEGVHRFLGRVWRLYVDKYGYTHDLSDAEPPIELTRLTHRTIKKVTEHLQRMELNTAISALMVLSNELAKDTEKSRKPLETLLLLLSPFAPHLCEELWQRIGHTDTLAYEPWPAYDRAQIDDLEVEIAVMINGRVKAHLKVGFDWAEDVVEAAVLKDEKVRAQLEGKKIVHKKYVPKKIYSLATN